MRLAIGGKEVDEEDSTPKMTVNVDYINRSARV